MTVTESMPPDSAALPDAVAAPTTSEKQRRASELALHLFALHFGGAGIATSRFD